MFSRPHPPRSHSPPPTYGCRPQAQLGQEHGGAGHLGWLGQPELAHPRGRGRREPIAIDNTDSAPKHRRRQDDTLGNDGGRRRLELTRRPRPHAGHTPHPPLARTHGMQTTYPRPGGRCPRLIARP